MNGLVILDKPAGMTSLAASKRVGRRFGSKRAGHVGTLDPLATGVLPVALDDATRLVAFLPETEKRYRFAMRLGEETDSGDSDGRIVAEAAVPVLTAEAIEAVLVGFRGTISQTPPAFSAIKREGVPLYKRARRGETVAPPERTVTIHALRLAGIEPDTLGFEVTCSPGTYVRSLAVDIGRALGTAGHLTSLRRTASSGFDIAEAVTLDQLDEAISQGRTASLARSLADMLGHLPAVTVTDAEIRKIRQGQRIPPRHDTEAVEVVRLLDSSGSLVAVAESSARCIRPLRVIQS